MPRQSSGPRYFKSKQAWYAELNRRRTKLCDGPKNNETERIATEVYVKLREAAAVERKGDRSPVWAILNAYLEDARTRPAPLAPGTWKNYRACMKDFVDFEIDGRPVREMEVRDLQPKHFYGWLHQRKEKGWSDNYGHWRLAMLRTAFLWAAGEGDLIGESPLARRGKKVKIPARDLRLKRLAITADEHNELLARARRRKRGNFAELLEILWATGARPAEVYKAEGPEWNRELQAVVADPRDKRAIGRVKNRRHLIRKGKDRIIRIPDRLVPMVEKLVADHPTDEIFRDEKGEPWPKDETQTITLRFKSLVKSARRVTEKEGRTLPRKGLSLYSYRHAFVTRWLMDARKGTPGRDLSTLCELLDTSIKVIHEHYSHLLEDHKGLLDAVNSFY